MNSKGHGSERVKATGAWRRFYNEELHDLHPSQSFVRVIKSRSIRWAEHLVPMRDRKVQKGIWGGNLKEGDHLEDLGVRR
jgi:hypothetical protein